MATLILSFDNTYISEYPLNKASIGIGRRSTNDIHLDNLAVSGDHAMIVKMAGDFYIEDLASTNGTLVNDEFVKKQLLKNGDVIELGKYQLKYIDDVASGRGDAEQARPAFEKTMMIHPSAMKSSKAKLDEVSAVVEQATTDFATHLSEKLNTINPELTAIVQPINNLSNLVGKIQVLNGSGSGRELVLNKTLTTLGKVGIQVAVITKRPHGYFITHVEGLTLPVVNGTSAGRQSFALNDHDVIELAGIKMEFYLTKS